MTTKLNPDLDPDTEASDTDAPDTHDESRTATDDVHPAAGHPRPDIPDARLSRLVVPSFGLSATQLTGTALAAITATVAASYLGVTGTVIGAALASVLTAIGNAVYTTSLRTTRDRVRDVVPLPARTRSLPAPDPPRTDGPPSLPSPGPRPTPRPHRADRATPGSSVWQRAAIWAVGVFVVLMAVVTGVEVLAGRPVSDLVRGDSGGGTSFFGHDTVRTKTVPPVAPTVYVTVTPKVVVTTPTQTRTAPAAVVTAPPTATATVTPSTTTTPTDTATPTAQPSSSSSSTP